MHVQAETKLCISRPFPVFVILHRWIFDLKPFNLASTAYHVGYFHIWHVSHLSVIHQNVCGMCQLLNCYALNRCLASCWAEAKVCV